MKRKEFLTQKDAIALLELNKENTAFFGNQKEILSDKTYYPTYGELYNLFRIKAGMGLAETDCIIGALVKSGAKIKW